MKCACCKEEIEQFLVKYPPKSDFPICPSCYSQYVDSVLGTQKIVFVKGQANDYAAYRGWCCDFEDWQIAAFGVKLDEATAKALSPSMSDMEYRK